MANVRAMLARVAKLEAQRSVPLSPFEQAYGSMDAFEELANGEIEVGKLDRVDMPVVLQCLRRWHSEGVWQGWHRGHSGVWEAGR